MKNINENRGIAVGRFISVGVILCCFSNFLWGQLATPLGSAKAKKGGTFYLAMSSDPSTLNPLTSVDVYASQVHTYVLDRLMVRNYETYSYEPSLAERYTEDVGGKGYTFYIRKGVKWQDGTPLTPADVQFSLQAIQGGKYKTAHQKPYYENIGSVELVKDNGVHFTLKNKYFGNFSVISDLKIIPKHIYGDPKKKVNKTIVGSGPYSLEKYDQGKSIVLKRNDAWWGWTVPHLKGKYNFDKIFLRIVKEENIRLAKLVKGELDFESFGPEIYVKRAVGKEWGKTVFKKKVKNSAPKGYAFVAWNLDNPLFKERKVRVALAHLMNRPLMNEKFRFNMSLLATGPWYQQSPYADKSVKPIAFDPKAAKTLLTEAGWTDSDKNGVLDKLKDGKKVEFQFTLMYGTRDLEKYFTLYQEDLKKSGIKVNLKIVEWNSFVKSLNSHEFEAVALAWGAGSVDNDPKQIWHSSSSVKGGSNFNGYKNPKVDKLIEKGRSELDKEKRVKIYQEIYRLIADDAPYAFLFNSEYSLYGVNQRVKQDKGTFKYTIGTSYWWIAPK